MKEGQREALLLLTPPSPVTSMKSYLHQHHLQHMFLQIFMRKIVNGKKKQTPVSVNPPTAPGAPGMPGELLRSYQLHNNLRRTSLQIFTERRKVDMIELLIAMYKKPHTFLRQHYRKQRIPS